MVWRTCSVSLTATRSASTNAATPTCHARSSISARRARSCGSGQRSSAGLRSGLKADVDQRGGDALGVAGNGSGTPRRDLHFPCGQRRADHSSHPHFLRPPRARGASPWYRPRRAGRRATAVRSRRRRGAARPGSRSRRTCRATCRSSRDRRGGAGARGTARARGTRRLSVVLDANTLIVLALDRSRASAVEARLRQWDDGFLGPAEHRTRFSLSMNRSRGRAVETVRIDSEGS